MTTNLLSASAGDQGRAIAAGKADPVELTEGYLARAASIDTDAKIYVRPMRERALAEAQAARARARSGARRSLLDGVAISLKDNLDTAGTLTEAGSALLKGRLPVRDAAVVRRASAAGLVMLGKTNLVELAFSGLGHNPTTGTPANPFDTSADRLPGGSSSGAAVSVARALAAAAIGTDTGGSVRIPAAWNGLVGLKTTEGRLPLEGVVPLSPAYDTIGPLCRTVEDAARLYEILAGEIAIDLSAAVPTDLRFIAVQAHSLGAEPAVALAFERALAHLASAGAAIAPRPLKSLEELAALGPVPVAAEAYALWGAALEERPGTLFVRVEERILAGRDISASALLRYRTGLQRVRAAYREETAGFDGLLMPTVRTRAPLIASVQTAEGYREANAAALALPSVANRLGLCAITVPIGLAGEPPLPVGLSILGPARSERRLLQIASALERVLG